jgi:hypothetical protein
MANFEDMDKLRRDRTMRWLQANGVIEGPEQIVDNVTVDEYEIIYEVVVEGGGVNTRRIPMRFSMAEVVE